ncbi:MAG: rhodanese-like domain-containing protein [Solirubrobacterales bacterium]|nr:rhodanese-like domain-containing protein [Solirubrobacterales bacterium]
MEADAATPDHQKSPAEIEGLIKDGVRLIDVRQDYEFDAAHIAGAERIGLETLAEQRDQFDPAVPVIFYCRVGNRSDMAADAFVSGGYDVSTLQGGIAARVAEGKGIEPADGYVSEPGQAAAILEAKARTS